MKINCSDNYKWCNDVFCSIIFGCSICHRSPEHSEIDQKFLSVWLNWVHWEHRKYYIFFESSQKLGDQHIFVLLLCFFRKILKEEFSWLWINAKFSELMDNFICWIYSPSFVFRKQNFVAFLDTNVLDGKGLVKVWHCEWLWTSISKCFYCVKVKFHGGASRWKIETGFLKEYAYMIWCKWSGQPLNLCLCILSFESRKFIETRKAMS